MNYSKDIFDLLLKKINLPDLIENKEILFLIFEHYTGLSKTDILLNFPLDFSKFESVFNIAIERINNNEPVQYVLGETEFFSRKFIVNSDVLIPRPETEELVQKLIELKPKRILDLGTGSGCIAISLFLELKNVEVMGVDISEKALKVARLNQERLESGVMFQPLDILTIQKSAQEALGKFDMLVSNPPYVKNNEKTYMTDNVLNFEPHWPYLLMITTPWFFIEKYLKLVIFYLTKMGIFV